MSNVGQFQSGTSTAAQTVLLLGRLLLVALLALLDLYWGQVEI